jgi:hypothetical protein
VARLRVIPLVHGYRDGPVVHRYVYIASDDSAHGSGHAAPAAEEIDEVAGHDVRSTRDRIARAAPSKRA